MDLIGDTEERRHDHAHNRRTRRGHGGTVDPRPGAEKPEDKIEEDVNDLVRGIEGGIRIGRPGKGRGYENPRPPQGRRHPGAKPPTGRSAPPFWAKSLGSYM